MTATWIDSALVPLVLGMVEWSFRWCMLAFPLIVLFSFRPPKSAQIRHLLLFVCLAIGIVSPILPRFGSGLTIHSLSLRSVPSETDALSVVDSPAESLSLPHATESAPVSEPAAMHGKNSSPAIGMTRWIVVCVSVLWMVGVVAGLARILAGLGMIHRIRRSAIPLTDQCNDELADAIQSSGIRRRFAVGGHAVIQTPFTMPGIMPMIVVPANWSEWPSEHRRAAWIHELAHVARFDDWSKVGLEFVRSIFWFHPLVIWMIVRVDQERELICDEATVFGGIRADDLAAMLIGHCRAQAHSNLYPTLPFLQPKTIKVRVSLLLQNSPGREEKRMYVGSKLFVSIMAAVIFGAIGAVRIRALAAQPVNVLPTPSQMLPDEKKSEGDKKTTATTPQKQPAAAVVLHGTLTDEKGDPLPGVKVQLYSGVATRFEGQNATTDSKGTYRFEPLSTGAYFRREKDEPWDFYIGIRLVHDTHVCADGMSWHDITVSTKPGHSQKQDFKMVPGGKVTGTIVDAKTKMPLKLDLRLLSPVSNDRGHNVKYSAYLPSDENGRFTSPSLFPGEYTIDVNATTLRYPLLGQVKVEAKKTVEVNFSASLPRQITGKVVDENAKPVNGAYATILLPQTKEWTIERGRVIKGGSESWSHTYEEGTFKLAVLPGLESADTVVVAHKKFGSATISIRDLDANKPVVLKSEP